MKITKSIAVRNLAIDYVKIEYRRYLARIFLILRSASSNLIYIFVLNAYYATNVTVVVMPIMK